MDISQYEIDITMHALMRAYERGIDPEIMYTIIRGGLRKDFGKDYAKWSKTYKTQTITCVGQIKGNRIKIFTITIK